MQPTPTPQHPPTPRVCFTAHLSPNSTLVYYGGPPPLLLINQAWWQAHSPADRVAECAALRGEVLPTQGHSWGVAPIRKRPGSIHPQMIPAPWWERLAYTDAPTPE